MCVVWYMIMCINSRKTDFAHSGRLLVAGKLLQKDKVLPQVMVVCLHIKEMVRMKVW